MSLKHPLLQAVLLMLFAYFFYTKGIGILSAPIPGSLVSQYLVITLGVVLLYMASDEKRWTEFKNPIFHTLLGSSSSYKLVRLACFVVLPLFAGYQTYNKLKPSTEAPPPFRTVHPANPSTMTFRGETYDLATLSNPLRADEANHDKYMTMGKQVYYERCFFCHGDTWAGDGHFAKGFVPAPAKFTGDETLAILSEAYVFWRIAKGGPGLPREATPWNSAMPAWEDRLSAEETWAVIMYLYDAIGKEPRAMGHEAADAGGH